MKRDDMLHNVQAEMMLQELAIECSFCITNVIFTKA